MKASNPVRTVFVLASLLMAIGLFTASSSAQDIVTTPTATPSPTPTAEPTATATPTAAPSTVQPHIADLRGVSVGMTKDEVKDKLGGAETSDKTGMYYSFSKTESAQIGLDADGKVRTIAVIYTNGDKDAPSFADVFGADVAAETKENGDIYKLVRYPDAKVYVSYSQTDVKDKPMTVVTMRKMLD